MSVETLRRAAAQIRNDRGGVISRRTQDGRRWLPIADWLDAVAAGRESGSAEETSALAVANAYLSEEA